MNMLMQELTNFFREASAVPLTPLAAVYSFW
jgi:hypothetical protein